MRGNRNAAPVANDKNGTQIKFKDSEYYPKSKPGYSFYRVANTLQKK